MNQKITDMLTDTAMLMATAMIMVTVTTIALIFPMLTKQFVKSILKDNMIFMNLIAQLIMIIIDLVTQNARVGKIKIVKTNRVQL